MRNQTTRMIGRTGWTDERTGLPVRENPHKHWLLGTADGLDGHSFQLFLKKEYGIRGSSKKKEENSKTCPSSPSANALKRPKATIHAGFERTDKFNFCPSTSRPLPVRAKVVAYDGCTDMPAPGIAGCTAFNMEWHVDRFTG